MEFWPARPGAWIGGPQGSGSLGFGAPLLIPRPLWTERAVAWEAATEAA